MGDCRKLSNTFIIWALLPCYDDDDDAVEDDLTTMTPAATRRVEDDFMTS